MTSWIDAIDLTASAVEVRLRATDVATLTEGRIYDTIAPPGAPLPHLVFALDGTYTNTSPRDDVEISLMVRCFATKRETVQAVASAVVQALHRQQLQIPGWSNYWLAAGRFERDAGYQKNEQYHVRTITFEIRADDAMKGN